MTDLRTLEASSIRDFVQRAADEGYLSGRVLDYGCGKQPYRDIVEAGGGEYTGFDRPWFPAYVTGALTLGPIPEEVWEKKWDAVLCTQVLQYIPLEELLGGDTWDGVLDHFARVGKLVLTYPTNWPEVEPEDLHRFTKAGMERLLTEAGFTIVRHERRGFVQFGADTFNLGHGVICRA